MATDNLQLGLVLKRPKDKPPFIGVQFDSDYLAGSTNQGWVNNYPTYFYEITLEPINGILHLSILQPIFNFKHTYKIQNFDSDKLKLFLLQTHSLRQFSFGHVMVSQDKHVCVRTTVNRALWVLKVNKITFLIEH